jgi:phage shock protein A
MSAQQRHGMASRTAASHEGFRQIDGGYRADRSAPARDRRWDGSHCGAAWPAGPGHTIGPGSPASEGKWAGMSIGRRLATLFRVKANKALDGAEDPREILDYSYEQQLEMVQKVRRGLADVATSRRRVGLQVTQLELSAGRLQDQAQQALAAGHEDLARAALIRRAAVTSQISDLQGQQASLQAEEDKLTLATQRLQGKVDAFRTRKETIKAAYTAAEAQTNIGEAVTGISEEMSDIGMAMQRAQDKTEQMQARAGALDELMASGALQDATVPGGRDDVQSQLDALTAGHDVDDELARMKAQLPASAAPPAVEGPGTASADPPALRSEQQATS